MNPADMCEFHGKAPRGQEKYDDVQNTYVTPTKEIEPRTTAKMTWKRRGHPRTLADPGGQPRT